MEEKNNMIDSYQLNNNIASERFQAIAYYLLAALFFAMFSWQRDLVFLGVGLVCMMGAIVLFTVYSSSVIRLEIRLK